MFRRHHTISVLCRNVDNSFVKSLTYRDRNHDHTCYEFSDLHAQFVRSTVVPSVNSRADSVKRRPNLRSRIGSFGQVSRRLRSTLVPLWITPHLYGSPTARGGIPTPIPGNLLTVSLSIHIKKQNNRMFPHCVRSLTESFSPEPSSPKSYPRTPLLLFTRSTASSSWRRISGKS